MVAFKSLGPISHVALLAALHSLLGGCNTHCKEGTEECGCTADDRCEAGLVCEESVCRADESGKGAKKPPKDGSGGTGSDSGPPGGPPDPDDDAGAAGSGNASGGGGSGGADDGGSAGAGAAGGSSETGGSGGADSGTGGSENSGGSGSTTSTGGSNAGGTNAGGMNAGGMGGGVAGSGGASGPVPFPAACWSCAVEGCFRETSTCRADTTCAACITTSYSPELCAANAEYAEMAACFCSNFCAARCTDVCE